MEQTKRRRPHFERALLVVGDQNAGKSHLLRELFIDHRFGTAAKRPKSARIRLVPLSNERSLFIRCSSPHENNETLDRLIKKIDRNMELAFHTHWRFNFACALQPYAANQMPDLLTICDRIVNELAPERIRIVQINPRQDGETVQGLPSHEIDALRKLKIEICTIDGRRAGTLTPNGLFLADFFDFT